MTQNATLTETEQKTIPSICILAAMADGAQTEIERAEIKRLAGRFTTEGFDLNSAYQEALSGQVSIPKLTSRIESTEGKLLAYEMAVCICNVDNALTPSEQHFLSNLHRNLGLDISSTAPFQQSAATLSAAPLAEPPVLTHTPPRSSETADLDEIILNRAILAGGLELMPQSLATMAIIPVQMQLVYQIGKRYGFDLDLAHTKEFLATVGVGMTSQVVESYLTRLVKGVTGRFAGKMITGLVTQAAESALAFATTYAIGQTAKSYYSSGRTLSMEQLRNVFSAMLNQGRSLKSQYAGQIAQRSSQLKPGDLLSLVR